MNTDEIDEKEGNCFVAAFHLTLELADRLGDDASLVRLCHGRPIYHGQEDLSATEEPLDGRFWHAWVELHGRRPSVWDFSNGKSYVADRKHYYRAGGIRPKDVVKYHVDDLPKVAMEYGHYGPWNSSCPPIEEWGQ